MLDYFSFILFRMTRKRTKILILLEHPHGTTR